MHALALCESAEVGEGTRVWAFAHVMRGARVGRGCNVCGGSLVEDGAVVGDDCVIKNGVQVWSGVELGDGVFVGPNATFANDLPPRAVREGAPFEPAPTRVDAGATIGANATVASGTRVGTNAFVAAGAVVTRDVPAHALVAGSPARRIGWSCRCGETLADDLACACGRRYRCDDERLGLSPAD